MGRRDLTLGQEWGLQGEGNAMLTWVVIIRLCLCSLKSACTLIDFYVFALYFTINKDPKEKANEEGRKAF